MKAKYYVYWNLHKKCYSVRFRGRVIHHLDRLIGVNATFRVSQVGRQRVLREQSKNVHAFVVCDDIVFWQERWPNDITDNLYGRPNKVTYNPYENATFVDKKSQPVYSADIVKMETEEAVFIVPSNPGNSIQTNTVPVLSIY
jgi:hypothetical protein